MNASRSRTIVRAALVLALVVLAPRVAADTIQVPADQPTIQAALAAAVNGDVILVAPGTYVAPIAFPAKAVILRSANGPLVTTLQGDGANPVVQMLAGTTTASTVEGFTITGGGGGYGAGVFVTLGGGASILRNRIVDNHASYDAGGIYNYVQNEIRVEGNLIGWNTAVGYAGGIHGVTPACVVRNNVFVGNQAAYGGAAFAFVGVTATFTNCTFYANSATNGTVAAGDGAVALVNCIARGHVGPPFFMYGPGSVLATYSDVEGGAGQPWFGTGCIDRDPLFVDVSQADFRLLPMSRALDAGNPAGSFLDPDGTRNDMGSTGGPAGELRQRGWQSIASLPEARFNAAPAASGSTVYLIGGTTDAEPRTRHVRAYTPSTNSWTALPDYPGPPIRSASACALDGYVYLLGGYLYDYAISDQLWRFDPRSGEWEARAPIPEARLQASLQELNGKLYVLGGRTTPAWQYRNTVFVYDPGAEGRPGAPSPWTQATSISLPTPLGDNFGVAIRGDLFTLGSYEPAVPWRFTSYSPRADRWKLLPSTPFTSNVWAARIRDHLFAIQADGRLWSWRYDPLAGAVRGMQPVNPELEMFEELPTRPQGGWGTIAAHDGLLFSLGGVSGAPYAAAWVYEP